MMEMSLAQDSPVKVREAIGGLTPRELRSRKDRHSVKHNSLWEGTRLGLVVATTIWIWLAAVDAIVLFRTHPLAQGLRQAEAQEND